MSNDKKYTRIDKKNDILQEPSAIYPPRRIESNSILNDPEEIHPLLEKLISKSIQDSKDGKGISHVEMLQKIKLKYPFLK